MVNQDLIKAGFPSESVLPGSDYWKKYRTFSARSSIWNFDAITTNKKGSSIILDASEKDVFASGGISLGANTVQMSSNDDQIKVSARKGIKLSQVGLEIQGAGDTYFSPTPASLLMGSGKNSIIIGGDESNWDIGIRIGTRALLAGGSGADAIRAHGLIQGISVTGTIQLGAGNDVLEGISMGGENGVHINNSGRVEMGEGDDIIIGSGGSRSIYVNGAIDMGSGSDRITGSSLHVNSVTGAEIRMGAGDDTISAPLVSSNGAKFYFGAGIDRMTLKPGTYSTTSANDSALVLSGSGIIDTPVYGLEFVTSSATGKEFAFRPGALTVI